MHHMANMACHMQGILKTHCAAAAAVATTEHALLKEPTSIAWISCAGQSTPWMSQIALLWKAAVLRVSMNEARLSVPFFACSLTTNCMTTLTQSVSSTVACTEHRQGQGQGQEAGAGAEAGAGKDAGAEKGVWRIKLTSVVCDT